MKQKIRCFLLLLLSIISINAGGANRFAVTGGNWSGAIWATTAGGVAGSAATPNSADVVTINNGVTVYITANAVANSVTVGVLGAGTASLIYNSTGSLSLTVTNNVSVDDGSFTVNNVSGSRTHTLTVGGDLIVASGCVFNMISADGTDVCNVTFNRNGNQTVSGTGTVAFNNIRVNMTSGLSNTLDIQSVITMRAGGLTLTKGIFKISSASTIVPFTADITASPYLIPNTCGLWCDGATINSTTSNDWTVDGLLRVSSGTVNIGIAVDDRFRTETGSLIIEGGTVNIAGRITPTTSSSPLTFNMSGGTLNLPAVGSASTTKAPFDMSNTTGSFTMSGGTIVIKKAGQGGGAANLFGFQCYTTTSNVTGGTLQIGDASTPAGQTIQIETTVPLYNLTVNSVNAKAQLNATPNIVIKNNLTITDGVFDVNGIDISVGGNWSNTSSITDPFLQGTRKVTFNGSGSQTISNTGNANGTVFYDVTLNNTFATIPQITMNTDATVQGTLTMTLGKVNLNANTLTLGISAASPGTLTYTAGWLYGGTFKRWMSTAILAISNARGLFPMGTSTVDYRPLWVGYSVALTTGGTVSVVHNPVYASTHLPVSYIDASWSGGTLVKGISNSSWDITAANSFTLNGSSGIVRFGGTGFNKFVLTDLNASLSAGAVGTFGAATSVNQPLEVNRTALSLGNFVNTWYIGTKDVIQSPLPVELLFFTAKPNRSEVVCDWVTASEINNDYFAVEKSTDGILFTSAGIIDGAGNSSRARNYQFVDPSPNAGVSYYRLKQTDYDGKYSYSPLKAVNFNDSEVKETTVFPNPASNNLYVSLPQQDDFSYMIRIFDMKGCKAEAPVTAVFKRNDLLSVDVKGLANGIYTIQVISGTGMYVSRFVKE